MESLLLTPANKEDADLLKKIAKKMRIKFAVINEDDKEDYALARLMHEADKSEKTSEESILLKLNS